MLNLHLVVFLILVGCDSVILALLFQTQVRAGVRAFRDSFLRSRTSTSTSTGPQSPEGRIDDSEHRIEDEGVPGKSQTFLEYVEALQMERSREVEPPPEYAFAHGRLSTLDSKRLALLLGLSPVSLEKWMREITGDIPMDRIGLARVGLLYDIENSSKSAN